MTINTKIKHFPDNNAIAINHQLEWPIEKCHNYSSETSKLPDSTLPRQLIQQILNLPGVRKLYISPYELILFKGSLFEWPAIIEQAIAIMEKLDQEADDDIEQTTAIQKDLDQETVNDIEQDAQS